MLELVAMGYVYDEAVWRGHTPPGFLRRRDEAWSDTGRRLLES